MNKCSECKNKHNNCEKEYDNCGTAKHCDTCDCKPHVHDCKKNIKDHGCHQFPNCCVTTEKLADKCVTGKKICEHTITSTHLSPQCILNCNLTSECVCSHNIADNSVTSEKLGNNCIHSNNLTDCCIKTYHLSHECVTLDQLDHCTRNHITHNCVTLDDEQTLTHKIINDPTNTVACDYLHYNNGTSGINVSHATQPLPHQCLTANSSSLATWQLPDHLHMANTGLNTHSQIDAFIASTQNILNNINSGSNLNCVTLDGHQVLTNKIIDDPSNVVTANFLADNNGKVNVDLSNPPTINQALIATDDHHASWQTINHFNLSNIGTHTHAQIDDFILSTQNILDDLTSDTNGVTLDGTQTLTHKTIDDPSNVVTADFLHTNNGTYKVNVSASNAPITNQCLVATDGTHATWQTLNHNNLSNIGTKTHAQIDSHINSSNNVHGITGNVVGTTDTQLIQNKTFDSTNTFPNDLGSSLQNFYVYNAIPVTLQRTYSSNPGSPGGFQNPSNPYVPINSLSLVVPTGTYYVSLTMSINVSQPNATIYLAFSNGNDTAISNTIMKYIQTNQNNTSIVSLNSIITATNPNPIKALINVTISNNNTNDIVELDNRSLCALKIA